MGEQALEAHSRTSDNQKKGKTFQTRPLGRTPRKNQRVLTKQEEKTGPDNQKLPRPEAPRSRPTVARYQLILSRRYCTDDTLGVDFFIWLDPVHNMNGGGGFLGGNKFHIEIVLQYGCFPTESR